MKVLLISSLIILCSIHASAQVATNAASKNLTATKTYQKQTTVVKKQSSKNHSIKRTVKLIREEKEIPTKS